MKRQRKAGAFWAFVVVLFALIAASSFVILSCDLLGLDDKKDDGGGTKPPFVMPDSKYRIYIDPAAPTEFRVDGKRIWINGANTPYFGWNGIGGNNQGDGNDWGGEEFKNDKKKWSDEFALLKANGMNATRVWLTCNGAGAVQIDANNKITVRAQFWNDLDELFTMAAENKIYIMATLISFNHFNDSNSFSSKWQAMIKNQAASQSFVDNYTKELLKRYKDNPYLWSIDICNEPDWINEDGGKVDWNDISRFLAMNAAAIHENSDVLVTVGMAYAKWNSGGNNVAANGQGNKVSDQFLKGRYNNANAYLDFWSPHYYSWNGPWYGVMHYLTPYGNRDGSNTAGYSGGLGITSDGSNPKKPAVIGECSASGTGGNVTYNPGTGNITVSESSFIATGSKPPTNNIQNDYQYAFDNGWQGVMPWTSNAVDSNGGLYAANGNPKTDLGLATKSMESKYSNLIYPLGK